MIASSSRGASFRALALYLQHGSTGREEGRIEWASSRNLPGGMTDPAEVAEWMRLTALQSRRTSKPVYHLALSWHADDRPDRAQMEAAADRVLRALGLSEHQVLIAAHNDTDHPHVHLMINRVHPQQATAWRGGNDWRRIQTEIRRLERENAWVETPGRLFLLPGQQPPSEPGIPRGEFQHFRRTGELAPSARLRETARPIVEAARSWPELEARLRERGLHLVKKGRGLVVRDGGGVQLKLSSLDRGFSRWKLEERFGQSWGQWQQARATLARAERSRAGHEALLGQRDRLRAELISLRDRLRGAEGLGQRADRALDELGPLLSKVYRDPHRARRRLRHILLSGSHDAPSLIARHPQTLAPLHGRLLGAGAVSPRRSEVLTAVRELAAHLPAVAEAFEELGREGRRATALSDELLRLREELGQVERVLEPARTKAGADLRSLERAARFLGERILSSAPGGGALQGARASAANLKSAAAALGGDRAQALRVGLAALQTAFPKVAVVTRLVQAARIARDVAQDLARDLAHDPAREGSQSR